MRQNIPLDFGLWPEAPLSGSEGDGPRCRLRRIGSFVANPSDLQRGPLQAHSESGASGHFHTASAANFGIAGSKRECARSAGDETHHRPFLGFPLGLSPGTSL